MSLLGFDAIGRLAIGQLPRIGFVPPPVGPISIYRLLVDHYLATGYALAGSIVTTGIEIPPNWPPSVAVEPLNSNAIQAFWNVGPMPITGVFYPRSKPTIYWAPVPGQPGFYQLTGAGAILGPKGI